eukprot:1137776-Pelagomonas_calceolata.AAC.4
MHGSKCLASAYKLDTCACTYNMTVTFSWWRPIPVSTVQVTPGSMAEMRPKSPQARGSPAGLAL